VNVQYPPIVYAQPTYYPPLVTPAYQQPYNGVSLTQVPYTGLESNMKVILFTLALILWSAVVTYVVVIRRRAKLVPATISGMAIDTVNGSDEAEQTVRQEVLMSHDNLLSNLESFARTQNVIVSSDALEAIADAGNDQKGAETLLTSLAHRHATGEGWTTIDLHKVKEAIG
jgi:hypothetical protein